ncbi:hypothetical protein [Pseudomonas sp. SDO55104_S430]
MLSLLGLWLKSHVLDCVLGHDGLVVLSIHGPSREAVKAGRMFFYQIADRFFVGAWLAREGDFTDAFAGKPCSCEIIGDYPE